MAEGARTREHGNAYNIFILVLTVLSLVSWCCSCCRCTQRRSILVSTTTHLRHLPRRLRDEPASGPSRSARDFIDQRGWLDLLGSIPASVASN